MEKFTKYINESLQDKLKDKLTDAQISLKRGILDLLDKSVDNEDLIKVQNLIHVYIEKPDSSSITGFIDDNEIFEFYLKYQSNIDEICNDKDYFSTPPTENNVFSLYSFVISGTKYAVLECLKVMEKELF